ncbi:uncharacterized protein BDZ83DRAFT_416560 [Colletotrichum acutatum]|uniref:Uncharacterized protein n=1 Tax=Glomerella acutata TaxID=27357 RepID=A0AAD8XGJ5_GLOAC|nr:uncharacterized protein BDZ83DRAFT_416560 [Colletotrichum acutatum]KAK1722565.1 hypothetical protein BDZ83DRAFT_416560 [Colletotrichum acutatum]
MVDDLETQVASLFSIGLLPHSKEGSDFLLPDSPICQLPPTSQRRPRPHQLTHLRHSPTHKRLLKSHLPYWIRERRYDTSTLSTIL